MQILVIPACHRIGAAGVAALEQAPPSTATICGFEASLVAAVCPPSALHRSSSALSLIGWPSSLPPISRGGDLRAALRVETERGVSARQHPIAADLDRSVRGYLDDADGIRDRPDGLRPYWIWHKQNQRPEDSSDCKATSSDHRQGTPLWSEFQETAPPPRPARLMDRDRVQVGHESLRQRHGTSQPLVPLVTITGTV